MTPPRLLVVDDDAASCAVVAEALRAEQYEVATATGGQAALRQAQAEAFDVIVADLRMPDLDGLALLQALQRAAVDVSVILMTAYGNAGVALEAIKTGAYDYVSKPLHLEDLRVTVARAIEQRRLVRESRRYRERLQEHYHFGSIVGGSQRILDVFKLIARTAPTRSTVLISGESGTGKELVARALHLNSRRAGKPFITIDCGGLAESLLESELFGHVRGAFTGAVATRRGLFEAANGGTAFLDEVGGIGLNVQAKLLRVLELQEVKPVGGNDTIKVDVRLIAATNKDLPAEVRAGRFREDLYYRLNVVTIQLPPLRERREDIPVLARHFLHKYCGMDGKSIGGIAAETLARLEEYAWPGNIRELENVIERAVAVSRHAILLPDDLPSHIAEPDGVDLRAPASPEPLSLDAIICQHLMRVLSATNGNKKLAAAVLGVDRKTLYRMLVRHSLLPQAPIRLVAQAPPNVKRQRRAG